MQWNLYEGKAYVLGTYNILTSRNQLALLSSRWCDGRVWALCCPLRSSLSAFLSVPQTACTPVTEGREILMAGAPAFLCMTVSVARQHMCLNWDRIWEHCWLRGKIFVRGVQGRRQGNEAALSAPCPPYLASLLPLLRAAPLLPSLTVISRHIQIVKSGRMFNETNIKK